MEMESKEMVHRVIKNGLLAQKESKPFIRKW
jgi:hypothetical protein